MLRLNEAFDHDTVEDGNGSELSTSRQTDKSTATCKSISYVFRTPFVLICI